MTNPSSAPEDRHFLRGLKNSYAKLPTEFYTASTPSHAGSPRWILRNEPLAQELGLNTELFETQESLQTLSGNRVPPGATPIAQAYAGHQFGYFNPQLGDGRAILLGELRGADGALYDVQLKGAGVTAYSRNGDGRSAIGPVIREFIVSEAMHCLGVSTTRSLAAIATGDTVWRNGPVPGGVLTRIAASHVRVGTFEYFASRRQEEHCKQLAYWVIDRHYPHLREDPTPIKSLLLQVASRQAELVAHWMSVGFIHGVMNTDNSSISGQTIDYGPCAFMDEYRFAKVFSSIDSGGRYAYGNQPHIGAWNTMCLGQALLPLLTREAGSGEESIQDAIDHFAQRYETSWRERFSRKLGIQGKPEAEDAQLIESLLSMLEADEVDFTIAFRTLTDAMTTEPGVSTGLGAFQQLFPSQQSNCELWLNRWQKRANPQGSSRQAIYDLMRVSNPVYIPRNHQIARVIDAAERGDFAPAETMHRAMGTPYERRPEIAEFAEPPAVEERVRRTFCGT